MFDAIFVTNYTQAEKDAMVSKKKYRKFKHDEREKYQTVTMNDKGEITEDITYEIVKPKLIENGGLPD
jgi:hypothetical protein